MNSYDIPFEKLKYFTELRRLKCHEYLEDKHIIELKNIVDFDLAFNNEITIDGIKQFKLEKISMLCNEHINPKLIEQHFPNAQVRCFGLSQKDIKEIDNNLDKYSITISHFYNEHKRVHKWIYKVREWNYNDELSDYLTINKIENNIIVYNKNNVVLTLENILEHIIIIETVERQKEKNFWFGRIDNSHIFFEGFITLNKFHWGS